MLNSKLFLGAPKQSPHLVLIILNYTLPISTPYFWKRAGVRICADGGANRVYEAAPKWSADKDPLAARRAFLPDVITGDLDSIHPEIATFYSQQGIQIEDLSEDQDSTDLHKCIQFAERHLHDKSIPTSDATFLAIGAFGGRLDHTLSNINTLYSHKHLQLVLCGDGSLARLIPEGKTKIHPEPDSEGPGCGVIGLGQPVIASSSGLKWNLDNHELAVGGLISSSNQFTEDEVLIDSDGPLLWMTEFRDNCCS